MPIKIPVRLVDLVLLGPTDDRRQLQDSPILGDVWTAYAAKPNRPQDLLITPHKRMTAGQVAKALRERLKQEPAEAPGAAGPAPAVPLDPRIAYLQGLVAARLPLRSLLLTVVPMTLWWEERNIRDELPKSYGPENLERLVRLLLESIRTPDEDAEPPTVVTTPAPDQFTSLDRYLVLAGILVWAQKAELVPAPSDAPSPTLIIEFALANIAAIVACLLELYDALSTLLPADGPTKRQGDPMIFSVSLNRSVLPALERSVPAVKGDAARQLFKVNTSKIAWAVLDSGIDPEHRAFNYEKNGENVCRVKKVMDFTQVRHLLSLTEPPPPGAPFAGIDPKVLEQLVADRDNERPIDWNQVEKLITLKAPPPPASVHGTHVAGIIGASRHAPEAGYSDGMCPDIQLYDFRVLGRTVEDTEFAVISALQYIRWVNDRHSYITIHGANLSLSIPHNVRNYACGRTPVCNECQRLIEGGVVVVAAAGNHGYKRFETKDGPFESYTAFSITDPGNAEDVITVGATHGNWPHTYGVSFFSSRGPTGDGRWKPDLVAPGERIYAPIPGGKKHDESGPESGTSMAAPHVSGAAAMLMARYPELIGNPRRIKRILCETATDLGRERTFQGHGMLDVLRAFQSI